MLSIFCNMELSKWLQSFDLSRLTETSSQLPRWLFVRGVLVYLVYYMFMSWRKYKREKAFSDKHGCLPVEKWLPYKWPLALDILKRQYDAVSRQQLLSYQSQFFNNIGTTLAFKLFGNQGFVTIEPENVEAILSKKFEDWSLGSRRPGLFPMLGEGIFTQDGGPWRHSREILRHQFARVHRQGAESFDVHVEKLISKLSFTSGLVDLQPHFLRLALSTTTELLFGEPVTSIPVEETDAFQKAFDYANHISALRIRLADFEWLWKPASFTKACTETKDFAMKFVQLALKEREEKGEEEASKTYPFIIDLYKQMQNAALVRDQLIHVLLAGRDATAMLMTWTFFLLVRHPRVLNKLRAEIQEVTGGSPKIDRATIAKMNYLRCVIKEVQRLYPQPPLNVRVATTETVLPTGGGPDGKSPVFIPKYAGVGYSTYHMHRQKRLYGEDAECFRPERWLEPELENIGWGFMPFHGGPRMCLGRDFALTQGSCTIIRMLQKFPDIRLPPGTPVVPVGEEKQSMTILVISADGCKVLLD